MRPTRTPPTPPATTSELLTVLRAAGLLSADQVRRLADGWGEEDPEGRLRQLVAAGLLTAYQAERVRAGRARRLVLGQYRILDRLGAGGMGRVYKAEHVWMKRVVALKVVRGRKSAAAFRREVEVAARLAHPNIVAAYDAAEARGRLFLVMEYVDGIDLQRLVEETGPLPVGLVVEVGRQAARALQHLHERGLLHRDVKPANLLLTWPGRGAPVGAGALDFPEGPPLVKLLDLGLVRPAALRGGAKGREGGADLDGTFDYMAPERGLGEEDIRADLYSLGCTLYHLLTGQVPFPGGNWTSKLFRHRLEAPTPLPQLRPEVSAALAAVVERLLAREPAGRFSTPADLETALADLEGPPGGRAPAPEADAPCRRGLRLPGPWACFAVMVLGSLLGGAARFLPARGPGQPTPPARPRAAVRIEGRAEEFATLAEAVAAAPDGGTLTLQGAGPFRTPPLGWRGKALTLRAGSGARPRVERAAADQPWDALLGADRALTLVGIDVRSEEAGAAPLLRVDGAALRLDDCRLLAPAGRGPLVALRGGGELEVRGGRLEAAAVGVSAELGPGRSRLRLADCTVKVPGGAALSLWAAEGAVVGPAEVLLERATWGAGRVLACRGLPAPLAVRAVGNDFTFRDGLLSCAGYTPSPDSWRRLISWRGQDNRYHAAGPWVRSEGEALPVTDLAAWERLWDKGGR